IFITSDLTEPDNIAFGNATNGFKVTIRPAPGVSSTISLTQNNVIVPGHFIVCASNSEDLESLVKTDNFIIDGCSDDAGSTRSLTFLNRNDLEISNSRVILVYGDSDNFTIRNCNIINRSQSITDNGCTGVEFLSRNDGVNNYVPDNGTVENCSITALGSAITNGKFGTGIKQHSLGTVSSGLAQTGLTVKDCDITARYTGIYLGQTAGATLADNTIQLEQISPGIHLRGIWLNTANGSSGWSLDIFNNTMDQLINFDTGITAIDLGAANYMSPHDPITFNVYNNMICGFDFLATMTRYNVPYRGISFDYGSGYNFTIAFKCYFNSIYMPHFPRLAYTPGTVAGMKSAYAIGTPANYLARVLDIRNNSVRVEQYYSAAILYMRYMTNTIVTCDYNNLSADTESGAITGRFADFSTVTEYPALSDWQGAPDGTDSNSVALNPFDTHPPYSGTWTAPDNLLFTSYPSLKMLGTAVEGITTDIQGASRFSILPFMGCHEPKSDGPRIHIEPDSLDYGRCLVLNEGGAVNTGIITISNEGIQNLDIIGITMISGAVDFSIEAVDTPIAPGSTGLCAVRFTPETPGARSAVFRISSNDTGEPVKDFTVQGTGVLTKKLGEYPSGRGPSLVGNVPGADYLTLAEAAADFNAFTGAFTGDWTLRIASDLTEPANVAFGNIVTPPHRVIIRPVEGLSPSVTFTQTGVGAIPGHLIIGATNPNDPAAHVKTDRFTINGFSTDASSERSLTFMNRDDMAIDDSRLILVFGDSDNASIMNCNLLNRSRGNAENDCTAVEFISWNDGVANFIPDGGSV
ncbi:MAG TPA: hypothetical protein PLB62_11895, partial [Candidatus Sumerlaeota bacterium]|nr:hypothetical protein [Candidatus Sumerlaeota bacterium]